MRSPENFGWSFWNRPVLAAIAISALWHFFWFFSVTIVVSPPHQAQKNKPRLVSLGPVLGDDIFRTLVENRVEATPAFYRPRLTGQSTDLPVESAQRREPQGGVVSVPFGSRAQSVLEGLVGGRKEAPDFDVVDYFGRSEGASKPDVHLNGPAADRQVLFAPPKPSLPVGADPASQHSVVRIRFQIDASGSVVSAEITASSGYPEIDLLWLEYMRRFQFVPQGAPPGSAEWSDAVLSFQAAEA